MRDVETDQSKKPAESDHIAEDRQAELFNSDHTKRNFLIRAESGITDGFLGNELISFVMESDKNICLIDHRIFDWLLIISEVGADPGISNRRIVIKEKGHLITQLLQGHGEDMGDDPHRLASHSCENDSFHKVLPYKIQRLRLRLRMRRKFIP